MSTQLLEIVGITGAFFALLFLATILSENIRFVDSIISLVLGIISAIFGLTDLFSTSLGYIFYGEAIIFIVATFILAYRDLYG
jgi:hypothetical protein